MKTTLLLALTLTAGSAFAQQPAAPPAAKAAVQVDTNLASWLGCWRLEDDLTGTGARMCITPEQNGVRLQTIVGTQKGIDELVIPDGVEHPIADAECKGTERAEFSADGARVFRTTGVQCGKEAPRSVRSVAFMTEGPTWILVQHVSGELANTAVRVQRYRRAANQLLADGSKAPQPDVSLITRPTPEVARWDVADVIEASAKVPAEVIQAALTEVHHGFDLNKKTLIALDDADVHEEVINLMVALTFPKRFVVQRTGGASTAGISTGGGYFDPFMSPVLMGTMYDCFSPAGYGYRSYYSMCGSMAYGPYYSYYPGPYYGYGYGGGYYGGWVDLPTYPPVAGSGQPNPEGRAVNGRGYTQIHDRNAEPSPRISHSGNGTASGWSGNNNGGASSSGYSSGSSSSGGSSSGASGGDSGARMAVPKGGGGQ